MGFWSSHLPYAGYHSVRLLARLVLSKHPLRQFAFDYGVNPEDEVNGLATA
jgi:hypothetical protein